ncbi:hypothetical protein M406DRAFT_39069 [Cryphonectria parasitica EP155]|uniref:Uncharacterized protein n=1 Tax=Cryphonectria parasitica (strain ATCC 38755 / EP155) TaxID=660469 RepID=A0A9P4Y4V9_CRYP1|nr:uncharacterized protein M406DRAFT_39069 [Cryphonectria parasitica EP155]KAF3766753.1 hypothetical protein M406DRAFT_39069 [Cryphonectria parasitica EP155]
MLSFGEPTVYERSKCFFTYGRMPYLDPNQPPTKWMSKGKPWSTLVTHDFIRRVDLILPQETWHLLRETLLGVSIPPPEFHRITMSLSQILQGEFFTEYIKIGQLTMFLEKETYERAGLVGKPYGAKGNRGLRPRWVVHFDLRSPSMFQGKKGFDRLIHACKDVLDEPRTWLFRNVSSIVPIPNPLNAFHPIKCKASPEICEGLKVTLPPLEPPSDLVTDLGTNNLPEAVADIYEWLSLVRLQSPRITAADAIDPFLSRYETPGSPDEQSVTKLCTISWEGLLPPSFAQELLADVISKLPSRGWVSLSVSSFSKTLYGDAAESTFLRPPGAPKEYFLWDIKSHE